MNKMLAKKNIKKSIKKSIKRNNNKHNNISVKSTRKSPTASASEFEEGSIERGNDNKTWVIVKNIKGIKRWVPFNSALLNGMRALTVNILAESINKPIEIMEIGGLDGWPISFIPTETITPSGDALVGKNYKKIKGWLKTQTPNIPNNTMFFIEDIGPHEWHLQVDSKDKQNVSSNIMNMVAFVRI